MNNQMLFSAFQNFQQNPGAFLSRLNIPAQYQGNPSGAIQYLMDSGRITQQQYNQAKQMAGQLQNNPMFAQLFKR